MFKIFSKLSSSIKNPFLSAIVLCAGSSTRFGENKQRAMIGEKTVAERTLEVFQASEAVREIILVVPKEDIQEYQDLIVMNDFKKVSAVVTGGETRQASAMRGFKHVSEKAKLVAIHDGARCLITTEIIEEVYRSAIENRCACAGTKVTDTIKLVDDDDFVKRTVDREYLWSIQTPQIFDRDIYAVSVSKAIKDGIIVTDDCMLVEHAKFKVKLVECGKENIKITHKSDIILAEHILKNRSEE